MYSAKINHLFVVGISHRSAPLEEREKFHLSEAQVLSLLREFRARGICSIFPLVTCNRVEIYSGEAIPGEVVSVLCNMTGNKPEVFYNFGYILQGELVVEHLFHVAVGLDSRLTGDAQITGQIRQARKQALAAGMRLRPELNRLIEAAVAAGKKIRSETGYNTGAHSLSHAAIRYLKTNHILKKHSRVLLVGTGKMGRLALKSLLKEVPASNITLINRRREKAAALAAEFGLHTQQYTQLRQAVSAADIILVATAACEPLFTAASLSNIALYNKTFVDLSVPRNVEPGLPATVVDIDQIGLCHAEEQQSYIRHAQRIISETVREYQDWLKRYELAQTITAELHSSIFDNHLDKDTPEVSSRFLEKITFNHLRHFQKVKQSSYLVSG
ncbi:MAG: glutamyl-tRNA reductase [Chitinophagales bacterium]|nr:MAG: glutamyl-tRNA reductase [Chitinophagales bacterium]